MATAQNIIEAALRKVGNHSPKVSELNIGLTALQQLLASWSAERLMVYEVTVGSHILTIGNRQYTIGSSGSNILATRPLKIVSARLQNGNDEYPLRIDVLDHYNEIANKSISGRPTRLYYVQEYPLGRILLDRLPDLAYALNYDAWSPLTTVATLSTTLTLPPEYDRALVFNLAVDLAADYDGALPKEVYVIASQAKEAIEGVTVRPPNESKFDPVVTHSGRYDITTDTYS